MKFKSVLTSLAVVGCLVAVLSVAVPELQRMAYFSMGFNDHPTWYTESSLIRHHHDPELLADLNWLEKHGKSGSDEHLRVQVYAECVCLEKLQQYEQQLLHDIEVANQHGYDQFSERRQQLLSSVRRAIDRQQQTVATLRGRLKERVVQTS